MANINSLFTQPQRTFFFVFKKLDKTYHWPNFPKYTQQDIEVEAAELLDSPINDDLRFGDIWEKRLRGELINIEEGIFSHWHWGRTVLLGDAAHKASISLIESRGETRLTDWKVHSQHCLWRKFCHGLRCHADEFYPIKTHVVFRWTDVSPKPA